MLFLLMGVPMGVQLQPLLLQQLLLHIAWCRCCGCYTVVVAPDAAVCCCCCFSCYDTLAYDVVAAAVATAALLLLLGQTTNTSKGHVRTL